MFLQRHSGAGSNCAIQKRRASEELLRPYARCTGEEARAIERRMLRPIPNFTLFADDTLVPDHYAVHEHLEFVPFGLPVRRQETGGVGHHFVPYQIGRASCRERV